MKITLIILFLITQSVNAGVIINEVLSNEPGQFTSLEWIELYNNSNNSIELSEYSIIVGSKTILLPSQTVDPFAYIIICKKLFSLDGSPSFESSWGNGSNVWGDNEYESTNSEPIEASFLLLNDSGSVLLQYQENIVSTFNWTEKGIDGSSWERKFADSSFIYLSKSKLHATPGYINSVTLVQNDLAVESVSVVMENFIPQYRFTISNRGLKNIHDATLHIYDSSSTTILKSFNIPYLPSDSSLDLKLTFELLTENLYVSLNAIIDLPNDTRIANDTLKFTAVSQDYPPILISEFLANPQAPQKTEWIEIYNRSNQIIDLQNWFIGDAYNIYPITTSSIYLSPDQYVILTKSKNDFLNEYPSFGATIIELKNWAILNNEDDKVRLFDLYNIEADNYYYATLYNDNYTASREISINSFQWGRSELSNGTPGIINKLFETHNSIKINLSSKYISPDNDGFEDVVMIDLVVPISENYTLKLYDINGTVIKTYFSDKDYIPNQLEWNGLSENNSKLPIGIYIFYLSTYEGLSTKETIVIAR